MASHCIGALAGADSGLWLRRRADGYNGACAYGSTHGRGPTHGHA